MNEKTIVEIVRDMLEEESQTLLQMITDNYDTAVEDIARTGEFLEGNTFAQSLLYTGVVRINRDRAVWDSDPMTLVGFEQELNTREADLFCAYCMDFRNMVHNLFTVTIPSMNSDVHKISKAILLLCLKHIEFRRVDVKDLEDQFALEMRPND